MNIKKGVYTYADCKHGNCSSSIVWGYWLSVFNEYRLQLQMHKLI